MKTIILVIVCLGIGFGLGHIFLRAAPAGGNESDAQIAQQLYTCGMHPEIVTSEPGYCPICEMKLTPKKEGGAVPGAILVDPATRQNMGLATTAVDYRRISRTVRAFANVDYSEPKLFSVNLKVEGWIERLLVNYEGETVRKGQPLVEIYSPALVTAQQDFLIAHRTGGEEFSTLLAAAHQRLKNWDISEEQIERLIEKGEIMRTMTLHSPVDGVVISRLVEKGDHLEPGAELYQIADLSEVWVMAHIYEQDLPFIKLGQMAEISLPNLPGQTFSAEIAYISPFLDSQRQAEIRLNVPNQNLILKPKMYAEVNLAAVSLEEKLAVPRSAIINSGTRQIVYVAGSDGTFLPREVITGLVGDNDYVEILGGLSDGENVVSRGQFLLDSESRLAEALGPHLHGHSQSQQSMDSHSDSGHSTSSSQPHDHAAQAEEPPLSGVYTCPMPEHFHVLQYGAGRCPECGMNLVPVEQTSNAEVYVCPMRECGIAQVLPGDCPHCGMKLTKLEREQSDDH